MTNPSEVCPVVSIKSNQASTCAGVESVNGSRKRGRERFNSNHCHLIELRFKQLAELSLHFK